MSRKIGIIGMGNVGAAVAHGAIAQGLADSYVFIDINEKKAEADAQDFKDAMANLPHYASIVVNDYAALEDADVIISSLGNIQLQHNAGEDRFAEFPFTREAVYQVSQELKKLDFQGILLVISNPVDAVSALYQEDDLSVNPKSVSGYNLGEHGNSQFTAWSQVKVKGQDITELTSKEERQNLFMASMKGGHKVFYGKGYTSYGIASAALRLATIILSDAQEEVAVSSYQEAYQTYLGYPVILGRQGVAAPVHLSLSTEENRLLEESANLIRNRVQEAVSFLKEKYPW